MRQLQPATEVINNNRPIANVAVENKINQYMLQLKVAILKHKREYSEAKWKYEAAVNHYMFQKITYCKIESLYKVTKSMFFMELKLAKEYRNLDIEYHYDRKDYRSSKNYLASFTYQEEQSFLTFLKKWIINVKQINLAISIIYIFNQLSILAYNFGKYKGVYPSHWDKNQRAEVVIGTLWCVKTNPLHRPH